MFWGAALVFFLLRWINFHNDDLRGFWIETASQVENGVQYLFSQGHHNLISWETGLFTAISIGLIPYRVVDTYSMSRPILDS